MPLYVESNFVIELAFSQEQSEPCDRLVRQAESGDRRLVVPGYSLVEPHETLVRRRKRRLDLQTKVGHELGQIRRTGGYEEAADELREAATLFASSADAERNALRKTVTRLSTAAEVIPLTADIVARGYELQDEYDLGPQDSFVFASVLLHLEREPGSGSYFVTRNSKDFDDPDIKTHLRTRGCGLLTDFWDAARSA